MLPQAIIEIKSGEKQYKCMNSEWLVDDQGPIMFRMLSKLKSNGEVEAVMFSQRQDNRKYIYGTSVFPPADFNKYISGIREALWPMFPGAKFETMDFDDIAPSSYVSADISKMGPLAMIKIKTYWFVSAIINKIKWLIWKKPPA